MAYIDLKWAKSEPVSLREYAARCGFDLTAINMPSLREDRFSWIEGSVSNSIIKDLEYWFYDQTHLSLAQVNQGIYVISLADSICVDYGGEVSQVIYIGRGRITTRVRSHLKNWVLEFAQSLQDVRFTFWMANVSVRGNKGAFREVESDLLGDFECRCGRLPILNKNRGNYHKKCHKYTRTFSKPFRRGNSIQGGWRISPMPNNAWFQGIDA